MKVGKFLKSVTAVLAFCGVMVSANAGLIKTDIVIMVDESGSMDTVQTNIRNNIGSFATILAAGGIDARFALVGYGSGSVDPRQLTDFTDAATFATVAQSLLINGATEPAYDATFFALNALAGQTETFSYRNDAVKNLILFTDESSNGDSNTFAATNQLLADNNALFNAVLGGASYCCNAGAVGSDLELLATNNGGQVFDLEGLNTNDQNVVEQFVIDFANAKLQETIDFCEEFPNDPACKNVTVPEPASIALLSLGLLGFATRRKVQK